MQRKIEIGGDAWELIFCFAAPPRLGLQPLARVSRAWRRRVVASAAIGHRVFIRGPLAYEKLCAMQVRHGIRELDLRGWDLTFQWLGGNWGYDSPQWEEWWGEFPEGECQIPWTTSGLWRTVTTLWLDGAPGLEVPRPRQHQRQEEHADEALQEAFRLRKSITDGLTRWLLVCSPRSALRRLFVNWTLNCELMGGDGRHMARQGLQLVVGPTVDHWTRDCMRCRVEISAQSDTACPCCWSRCEACKDIELREDEVEDESYWDRE